MTTHHQPSLPDHRDAPEGSGLYLDLLKRTIRNDMYRDEMRRGSSRNQRVENLQVAQRHVERLKQRFGSVITDVDLTPEVVLDAWRSNDPPAHTVCSEQQVDNVRYCVEQVLTGGVPGDLIETGVFRGGQVIFMRGLLKAYGVRDRKVFVADSFAGLPEPSDDANLADAIAFAVLEGIGHFKATADEVRENFRRYGLLDDQVTFLEGWFADTLPNAPIDRLAVLRLDGDFYESTADTLRYLYPKLSSGGFVIVDDYGLPFGCRRAVNEFRTASGIDAPLQWVDQQAVYWLKP